MKKTKRIISLALVVITLMSAMSVAANAVNVSYAGTKYGYMAPTDATGKKEVSTVELYGAYDYIDFYIDCDCKNTYFFYEIYFDEGKTKLVRNGNFYCNEKAEYTASAAVRLTGVYKSGTYYGVTYAATISDNGDLTVSEPSVREFKIVVDRIASFKEQMIMLKGVKNTVKGPQITWQSVNGVKNYYVYRRPANSKKWTVVGKTSSSVCSFTDTSVKNKNGNYIYTVKAINKSGATTRYHYQGLKCLFAKAPEITSVATVGDNRIKIQWKSTSSKAGYEVYRRESGQSNWIKLANNYKKTYYYDSKAANGKTYEYTVRATLKSDYGVARSAYYDNSDKAVEFLKAPVITDVSAAKKGISVSWKAVNGAIAYTVYRKPADGSKGWIKIKTVSSKTMVFTDTAASVKGAYIYTVRSEGENFRGSYYTAGKVYVKS